MIQLAGERVFNALAGLVNIAENYGGRPYEEVE